jgi:lipoate-protein ligase A
VLHEGALKGDRVWRLIDDGADSGAANMARDEAILRSVEEGNSPPTLRLYSWSVPTISIGYLQSADAFIKSGLPVVRRLTGGRAVLHCSELTYSVVCGSDEPLYLEGIRGAYLRISSAIKAALEEIGLEIEMADVRGTSARAEVKDSCFHVASSSELLSRGKKIVGSAQRRFKVAFLQQGSIIFDIDEKLFAEVFNLTSEEMAESMTSVNVFSSVSVEDFKKILAQKLSKELGCDMACGKLSPEEVKFAETLEEEKYSADSWTINGSRQV